jgi:hypothetical protein
MYKKLVIVGIIIVCILIAISNLSNDVGDIFEDDKGRSFYFTGKTYVEIISSEHLKDLKKNYE